MHEQKAYDESLIKGFKAGRKECFDELVAIHSPRLYRVVFGLLGSHQDAEEIVQDTFVRAYKALGDFRGDSSFETWMHRIAMNLSRNRFHWNRRRGEGLKMSLSEPQKNDVSDNNVQDHDFELPDSRFEPDTILENTEFEDNVLKGIEKLPDVLREAMLLRHVQEMPYEKIASLLDCKVGTVKSRLARGRELLRLFLLNLDNSDKIK